MKEEKKEVEETSKSKSKVKGILNKKKKVKGKPLEIWLVVMILVFMLFTFGIGLFLGKELYEGKNKKCNCKKQETNTTIKNDTNEITNVDINDVEVQRLFNIFRYDEGKCFLLGKVLNTNNIARLRVAYSSMSKSYEETTSCKDYTPILKTQDGIVDGYCGESMTNEMVENYDKEDKFSNAALNNSTKKISLDNLKNHFMSIFSNSFSFNPEDFGYGISYKPGCQTFKFYQDKNEFVKYNDECGGTCGNSNQTILKAYKQGNKLFIETEYTYETNNKTKINYEFILEGNSYKFLNVVENNI